MWQVEPPRPKAADADYYEKRAVEEDAAVRNAGSKVARQRHEELAMMYRFRAQVARGEWPPKVEEAPAPAEEAATDEKAETTIWL